MQLNRQIRNFLYSELQLEARSWVGFLDWAVAFLSGAVGFLDWAVDFLSGVCGLSELVKLGNVCHTPTTVQLDFINFELQQ